MTLCVSASSPTTTPGHTAARRSPRLTTSPGRSVRVGREQGDWQFPFDSSMSALHALIRSEDADFVLVDAGSRNGVAVQVRGERRVVANARLLLGDQMLRAEIG